MSTPTLLLTGVRLHPNGRSYQVRISPYPVKGGFLTPDDANAYALELRKRKRAGILVPAKETTLADLACEHLSRLGTVGGRRGRPFSEAGLARARQDCRPWLGEKAPAAVNRDGVPFGALPISALDVRSVEVYLERRAERTPRAASGEHQALQAILRLASRRGETFAQGLLALEPIRRRSKRRDGLPLHQLRYLANHSPEYARRVLLLGSTLGCRIMEILQAEDAWLDLDAQTFTIPDWACKERREKTLDLFPEEVALFREQRLVRSPDTVNGGGGTPLLFPHRHGAAWRNCHFWLLVVRPTRQRAAQAWREEHELAAAAETPFDGWQPHDLRRGAASVLRELGIGSELIAARFGHADRGQLIEARYAADVRRDDLREKIREITAEGGIDVRLARLASERLG